MTTDHESDMTSDAAQAPDPVMTEDVHIFARAAGQTGALIGIDLGTKTIGLAASDITRLIASPVETLKRTKFKDDVIRLSAICADRGIAGLVLGLPSNMDGSHGPRVQATKAYARNLNAALPHIPILLWDERWTTLEAERLMVSADASRKRRKAVIDQVAATLILQSALDRLRSLPHSAD